MGHFKILLYLSRL